MFVERNKLFSRIVMVTRLTGHCAKEVPVGDALLGTLAAKSCLLTGLKHSRGCVIVLPPNGMQMRHTSP